MNLKLIQRDRLFELIDGHNLVGEVITLPFGVMRVELMVADTAIFLQRAGQKVLRRNVVNIWVAAGRGTGSWWGDDLADVIDARVRCCAVVPDALDSRLEALLAKLIVFFARDDLVHICVTDGDQDVRLPVSASCLVSLWF